MRKWLKKVFWVLLLLFILTNYIMYNHAYYFTHFVPENIANLKSEDINNKSFWKKLTLAIWGIKIGKPQNTEKPDINYKEVTFGQHPKLHAWWIPCDKQAKGIFIIFHGYNSSKSSQLDRARVIRKLGFHTFLVDMRGHGDSEGLETSIGYHEAEDVKAAYNYIKFYYDLPIYLLGTSMGAVSVLKAMHDHQLKVKKLIIECPFGSIRDAVNNRFENLKIPTLLLPQLLLFWGGLQNNMNCSEHNSAIYAESVSIPTLVLYGRKDPKVRLHEINSVYNALLGEKQLEIINRAGHDHLMEDDSETWEKVVYGFLRE
ncbi:MAG: lysophospholipase [Saprospiraceae bacterium]|nr:lysophospholipase [Saprospiraceae bacterium]